MTIPRMDQAIGAALEGIAGALTRGIAMTTRRPGPVNGIGWPGMYELFEDAAVQVGQVQLDGTAGELHDALEQLERLVWPEATRRRT